MERSRRSSDFRKQSARITTSHQSLVDSTFDRFREPIAHHGSDGIPDCGGDRQRWDAVVLGEVRGVRSGVHDLDV